MGIISTQGFVFKLIANGQQLDLFKDEQILLSDNVTGLFDLGILPADFTRQITIPGTKVNNAFFEHCYDISIQSPFLFKSNVKVPAYFDFGGIYLANGYLQLNKVNVIANKFIDSYEVTIYGGLSTPIFSVPQHPQNSSYKYNGNSYLDSGNDSPCSS